MSTSEDPDAVSAFEVWLDQAAHDSALEPDDIRALIEQVRPLIAGKSDRTELTVCGG